MNEIAYKPTITLGIDIGESTVKAVSSEGAQAIFPATTAVLKDRALARSNLLQTVLYRDQLHVVGQFATDFPGFTSHAKGAMPDITDQYAVLCAAAIDCFKTKEANIVLGLPVDKYSATNRQAVMAIVESLNAQGYKLTVIDVVPHLLGAFLDVAWNDNKRKWDDGLGKIIGVVDIGHHWIESIVVNNFAASLPTGECAKPGVSVIFESIAEELKKHIPTTPSHFEISEVLRLGSYYGLPSKGERDALDMRAIIEAGKKSLLKHAQKAIQRLEATAKIEKIIVTGGGALLIENGIREILSPDRVVFPENPVTSNARGMMLYPSME